MTFMKFKFFPINISFIRVTHASNNPNHVTPSKMSRTFKYIIHEFMNELHFVTKLKYLKVLNRALTVLFMLKVMVSLSYKAIYKEKR